MDFADRIHAHAKRVAELKEHSRTEEATKTSLIMPFLYMLGYDAFDPRVVVPEFKAHVGTKKGERVDYAIRRDGDVIILVEAKAVGDCLDSGRAAQLHRYFHGLPSAKIAILTDGVVYKFFTNLEKPNIMDDRPFMVFDFLNIEEALVPELMKLCNDCFNVEKARSAAQDLKYLGQMKEVIAKELKDPSDELARLLAKKIYNRPVTAGLLELFRGHVKTAFDQNINDIVATRLQSAVQAEALRGKAYEDAQAASPFGEKEREAAATIEEVEGFHIVRAILREVIDVERLVRRDTQNYLGILLDDNNRKPICRMRFNTPYGKFLETFNVEKKGTRHRIENLNDIFKYVDELKAVATAYAGRERSICRPGGYAKNKGSVDRATQTVGFARVEASLQQLQCFAMGWE